MLAVLSARHSYVCPPGLYVGFQRKPMLGGLSTASVDDAPLHRVVLGRTMNPEQLAKSPERCAACEMIICRNPVGLAIPEFIVC